MSRALRLLISLNYHFTAIGRLDVIVCFEASMAVNNRATSHIVLLDSHFASLRRHHQNIRVVEARASSSHSHDTPSSDAAIMRCTYSSLASHLPSRLHAETIVTTPFKAF